VDLKVSESKKIAADLVALVREKSHRVLQDPPKSVVELRAAKGLVLEDLLRILSLSTAGYRELKSGGQASVVALSRLHRLCKRSNVPESLIPDLCRYKTAWEAWLHGQRHIVNGLDFLTLKKGCADALRVHAAGNMNFVGLHAEAKALGDKFRGVLTSTEPLTDELVFGLIISLAVEAEQ
jgi:DNA-binding Xre family transcriptional regulator